MAGIDQCVLGARARVLRSNVPRVVDKVGVIVAVDRMQRPPGTGTVVEQVTVDIPDHGEVVVAPAQLEIVSG